MVKVNKLKAKIVERDLSIQTVAKQLGMNRSTLYRKLKRGSGEAFTVGEVRKLSEILQLTPDEITEIFFSKDVA